MTEFGNDMKAQMEEYMRAQNTPAPETAVPRRSEVKFECEVSGIDMVVSRIAGNKCTMKLFVYLSQTGADGRGVMFIKTMKDGSMKDANISTITSFFSGLNGTQATGSDAVPWIKKGKEFAEQLYTMRDPGIIGLVKEGLFNTDLLDREKCFCPWYAAEYVNTWNTVGMGLEDRHAKLIRHAVERIAEDRGITYAEALMLICRKGSWDGKGTERSVWAFSMLADIFDEPYAQRCFDEYIDNRRLCDLSQDGIRRLFGNVIDEWTRDWRDIVNAYKGGKAMVTFDKNRLWQFMQQAVGVGLGRSLDHYLTLYSDYLEQALYCDGKVRDKYPEYLQVAHDIYTAKYNMIREFKNEEALAKRVDAGAPMIDQVHDGYQLKVLRTVNEFQEEAQQNCNCVASYVDRVVRGDCWVASFRPAGSASTQLTVEIDSHGRLVQIKGKYNRGATEKEMSLLEGFQEEILARMQQPCAVIA